MIHDRAFHDGQHRRVLHILAGHVLACQGQHGRGALDDCERRAQLVARVLGEALLAVEELVNTTAGVTQRVGEAPYLVRRIAALPGRRASQANLRRCSRRLARDAASLVPGAGLEPAWPCGRGILSPLRLPISPSGRWGRKSNTREAIGGADRNRTGVHGFAGRCVTTPPPRREGSRKRGTGDALYHNMLRRRPAPRGLFGPLRVRPTWQTAAPSTTLKSWLVKKCPARRCMNRPRYHPPAAPAGSARRTRARAGATCIEPRATPASLLNPETRSRRSEGSAPADAGRHVLRPHADGNAARGEY